jgi:hypothetical protein
LPEVYFVPPRRRALGFRRRAADFFAKAVLLACSFPLQTGC